ncbi:MAG: electron transfer flavoprotein subunit beta/FixA family protein [Vulcanimicrobiaceae bacterium]
MKIVVTVKLVPDTSAEKRIDPATKRLVRSGVETVLNPFDEYALEAALRLREQAGEGTTVTVATVGPESGREIVRKALAMGADDAAMLADDGVAGSDVFGTAYALAHLIRKIGFDLVLTGTQSTDAITGELPGALAEMLGVPALTYLRKLEFDGAALRAERETDSGFLRVRSPLPALASIAKSFGEPRYPSLKGIMGAKKKPIAVFPLAELGLEHPIGSDGAKTELTALASPPPRGKGRVVEVADGTEGARVIVAFLQERKLL